LALPYVPPTSGFERQGTNPIFMHAFASIGLIGSFHPLEFAFRTHLRWIVQRLGERHPARQSPPPLAHKIPTSPPPPFRSEDVSI
jgi:hypothetical protein